ncbi:MAG: GntR family transcriptional regulator [Acidimicrobiia bacterium]
MKFQPPAGFVHRPGRQRRTMRVQTSPRRAHELMRASIRSGFVSRDHRLVEADLVKSLSTSRNAVRQALQMLADEGLVARAPRRGTSVAVSMVRMTLDQHDAIDRIPTAPEREGGPAFSARLLERRIVPATPYIRRRMGRDEPDVQMYEHLVSVHGEPIQVRVGYVPLGFDAGDIHPNEANRARAFQLRFGRELGSSEDAIEAVACEARTSKLLGVPTGSPVLLRETLLTDSSGVAWELSFRYNRGDRVSLCASYDASGSGGIERLQPGAFG